jgi:hypothetical protein
MHAEWNRKEICCIIEAASIGANKLTKNKNEANNAKTKQL